MLDSVGQNGKIILLRTRHIERKLGYIAWAEFQGRSRKGVAKLEAMGKEEKSRQGEYFPMSDRPRGRMSVVLGLVQAIYRWRPSFFLHFQ